MIAHEHYPEWRGGLLGWLGLRRKSATARRPSGPARDPREAASARQLGEIAAFLTYHRLDVNGQTLSIASNYLSGSDPRVVRLIDERVRTRQPVTQEWIEEAIGEPGLEEEARLLDQLMQRLERGVDEFGRTSREAREATSAYHSALQTRADRLFVSADAGAALSELAAITKAMLRRTVEIEKAMQRSEAQTRSLRRSLEDSRRKAEEDHLTGLPNRRAFETRYDREYRAARAAGEPLCVAFCDIDHFKTINDTHGHDAGDRVLRVVAESLARISGERCHVARHGGEEFVLLFRAMTLDTAFDQLDRLRAQLAARRMVNRTTDLPIGQVTFSAGIADVFASRDRRGALKAADAALYRAKLEGRNRICMAQPDESRPLPPTR